MRAVRIALPTLTLQLALPPRQYYRLRWLAATTDVSMGAHVREKIQAWLDSLPDPPGSGDRPEGADERD